MINCGMASDHPNPSDKAADHDAASVFLERLRGTYDVVEAIMFGSRARGDNGPDSDLAVVLGGRRGDFMGTRLDMAGTAFDAMLETGVLVQAFPLWDDDLAHPERFTNPALIRTIAEHGMGVGEACICPPMAAIGNAIESATKTRMTHLPMSPPRVLAAMSGGK